MMSERLRLKRATEKLVKSVGGIEAAASILDKGKSTVGRWQNRNDGDTINLADLRELEANAPEPEITRALARLAGGVFIALPQMPGSNEALPMMVMDLAREFGELAAKVSEGLANGHFDGADAERALDELHDVEACTAKLRILFTMLIDSERGPAAD